jgi:hypothetical protein
MDQLIQIDNKLVHEIKVGLSSHRMWVAGS